MLDPSDAQALRDTVVNECRSYSYSRIGLCIRFAEDVIKNPDENLPMSKGYTSGLRNAVIDHWHVRLSALEEMLFSRFGER